MLNNKNSKRQYLGLPIHPLPSLLCYFESNQFAKVMLFQQYIVLKNVVCI